jgi:hypothetical protein
MNTNRILKQAWQNALRYRALWVFGIILALTTSSWGAWSMIDHDEDEYQKGIVITRQDNETFAEAFERTMGKEIDQANQELDEFFDELNIGIKSDVVAFFTTLVSVLITLYVVGRVAHYVSKTALIRMVDTHQETDQKKSVRQGFRLGWSRAAWRLFLINLLVNLVGIAAGILLFALIFSPLPLWVTGGEATIFTGAILTGSLFFLVIFVIIVASAALALIKIFAQQASALERLGVTASIRHGVTMVEQNLKEIIPMGLVSLGLNLGWATLVSPIVFALLSAGTLLGGFPALALGGLGGEGMIIPAIAAGGTIFLLVLVAPLVFLGGLREVFLSSMWTLTYRELHSLEQPVQQPTPDAPPMMDVAPAAR